MLLNKQLDDSKKEKLWLVIILLGIIIALLSALYLYKYKNIKMAHDNVLAEQKLLRSQMTPHFVFNSLSVLQGMILNKEEQKSAKYLSKFSRLLRLILENSREKLVPLSQELETIQNYVDLRNMKGSSPVLLNINIDESVSSKSLLVPPMLIQPFIENAIVHGFADNSEKSTIDIEISLKQKQLKCIIKDNGIGLEATKNKVKKDKKSLSTQITSERLSILSKELKVAGKVVIIDRKQNSEHGTEVQLILPYKIA
jgi:sensor histidine kinase YesM